MSHRPLSARLVGRSTVDSQHCVLSTFSLQDVSWDPSGVLVSQESFQEPPGAPRRPQGLSRCAHDAYKMPTRASKMSQSDLQLPRCLSVTSRCLPELPPDVSQRPHNFLFNDFSSMTPPCFHSSTFPLKDSFVHITVWALALWCMHEFN